MLKNSFKNITKYDCPKDESTFSQKLASTY